MNRFLAAALSLLIASPAVALDIRSSRTPGTVPGISDNKPLQNDTIGINSAGGKIFIRDIDVSAFGADLPQIDGSGYLKWRGRPAVGRYQGGKFDISDSAIAPAGSELRTLAQSLTDEINIKSLKANVCTGNTAIDTAALYIAISKATLGNGGTIRMPACDVPYKFTVPDVANDPTGIIGFRIPNNTTLRGDGSKTVVTWNDDEAHHLFGSPGTAQAYAQNIMFRDFTVRGTAATRKMANAYPFLPYYVDGLRFEGVTSEYSRVIGIAARSSLNVSAERNIVRFAKRDGINFAQCSGVSIRNNDVYHIDDDAISASSSNLDPERVRTSVVITGNRIVDAQGIRVISGRQATISSNNLIRVRQHAVDVSTLVPANASVQEGMSAALNVAVTGNTITDLIDRQYVDNLNQGAHAIYLNGVSARAGTAAAIPGEPSAAGVIKNPAFEAFANSTSPNVPTPGSAGILVSGNVVARTLPVSDGTDPRYTKFSDYGYGKIWTRNGWVDPALPDAAFRGTFLNFSGGLVRDVLATSNVVRGLGEVVRFDPGVRYDNILIKGNLFSDISSTGAIVNTTGKLLAYVEDNIFDMDPNLLHPNRGANGTWQASTIPTAIYQQQGSGLVVRRNTFRNMARVFTGTLSTAGYAFDGNTVETDVSAIGAFSTANKGIGFVPEISDRLHYIQVGSDPASAAFGTILSTPTDWLDYTPSVTPASGSFGAVTVNAARYRISGGTLFVKVRATVTTVGSGTGGVYLTIPSGLTLKRPGGSGRGREDGATGKQLQVFVLTGGQQLAVLGYDNAPLMGSGYVYDISADAEIQ